MSRPKKQTRLSLAPLPDTASVVTENLAVNEQSQLANVRFGDTAHYPRRTLRDRSSATQTAQAFPQQGTIDMAFARSASRRHADHIVSSQRNQRDDTDNGSIQESDSSSEVDDLHSIPRRNVFQASKSNATAFFQASSSPSAGPIQMPRRKASATQTPERPRPQKGLFSSPYEIDRDVFSDEEPEAAHRVPPNRKHTRNSSSNSGSMSLRETESQDSLTPSTSGVRRSSRLHQTRKTHDGNSSGNPKPTKRSRTARDNRNAKDSPVEVPDSLSQSSEDVEPVQPKRGARRRLVRGVRRSRSSGEDSEVLEVAGSSGLQRTESKSPSSDSEESGIVVSSARKRRRQSHKEDSDIEVSASKLDQEQEDLDEDLDFLRGTSPIGEADGARKASKKEGRRATLKLIKARRASKGSASRDVDEDADDNGEPESDDYDEDSAIDDADAIEDGEDLEDFVLADDPDEEVIDHRAELPIELTSFAHKSLKYYFKDVVEWMVQNQLNPAFARGDPIYRLAFRKVNDEVQAYALSKFTSTTWRPNFVRAMQARPEFNEQPLVFSVLNQDSCMACGRSSHPATFIVTFTGKAYHPETLESLKDEDEDSNDEESTQGRENGESENGHTDSEDESRSVDHQGNTLPSEKHEFLVGRVCRQNAYRAHALTHWRFHLNSWVLDWLKFEGYLDAEQILERAEWSTKRKTKYANQVMDSLEDRGLSDLWRDFKIQLDTAKIAKTNDRFLRG